MGWKVKSLHKPESKWLIKSGHFQHKRKTCFQTVTVEKKASLNCAAIECKSVQRERNKNRKDFLFRNGKVEKLRKTRICIMRI